VAGAVSQRVERLAQLLVAATAERCGLAFAGLFGDRCLAGVARERVAGWVAGAAAADLGQQLTRRRTAGAIAMATFRLVAMPDVGGSTKLRSCWIDDAGR
jgi:hypothetical protein